MNDTHTSPVSPHSRNRVYDAIIRAEDDPDNNIISFAHSFADLAEETGEDEAIVRAVVDELKADGIAKEPLSQDPKEFFNIDLHKLKRWRRRLGI